MLVSWNLFVAAGFISVQYQLPALFCNRAASGCSSPPQIPRLVSSPTKTGGFLRAKLNFDKLRNKDIFFLPHSVRRFVGSSRTSAWDGEWIGRDTKGCSFDSFPSWLILVIHFFTRWLPLGRVFCLHTSGLWTMAVWRWWLFPTRYSNLLRMYLGVKGVV